MKKSFAVTLVVLLWSLSLFAQVKKGDKEIGLSVHYSATVGTEYSSGGAGTIQCSCGYFITNSLQIGVAPQFSFVHRDGYSSETFSASAFINYNFNTKSKTIPYVFGQWYQSDFSPEDGNFTDASFLIAGFGVRNFINEKIAINSAISYGFTFASDYDVSMLLIMSGFSFFL